MDVRGFTSLSEALSPQETIRFLNTVHGALSVPVVALDGTLDKYIGDSLMAFWNAPLDVGEHAAKAAEAALRMRGALLELNAANAFGLPDGQQVRIGIGIHTGIACVGNVGTQSRLNYSAVGDTVNTAARIEAACKDFATDILVSGNTARLLPQFRTRLAGEVHLRGKSHADEVFFSTAGPLKSVSHWQANDPPKTISLERRAALCVELRIGGVVWSVTAWRLPVFP